MSHRKEIIIEKVTPKRLICSDSTPISINVCRVTPSRKNAYRCHTEQKMFSGVSGHSSCALIAMVSISVDEQYYLKTKH